MSLAEPQKVTVRLESRRDGQTTVFEYPGTLYRRGNAVYVRYEETDEQQGVSSVTVKWDGDTLRILRRGRVASDQSFAPGGRRAGSYDAPPVKLRLETETTRLQAAGAPASGPGADGPEQGVLPLAIDWEYGLWINEQWAGRFEIRLRVR
jgi:uncharacterized beta-barrel protein YwiB (DUF1934 family)